VAADRSLPAPAVRDAGTRGPRRLWPVEGVALVALFGLGVMRRLPGGVTPWLLPPGWASLRLRGPAWRDVGFAAGPGLRRLACLGQLPGR
jgi:hypothetical protein